MKSEIQIHDRADLCRIEIEGTIGVPEEWQFETPDSRVATYERFRETLGRIARIESPEVIVEIRSTGGDVNDALLIHDASGPFRGASPPAVTDTRPRPRRSSHRPHRPDAAKSRPTPST